MRRLVELVGVVHHGELVAPQAGVAEDVQPGQAVRRATAQPSKSKSCGGFCSNQSRSCSGRLLEELGRLLEDVLVAGGFSSSSVAASSSANDVVHVEDGGLLRARTVRARSRAGWRRLGLGGRRAPRGPAAADARRARGSVGRGRLGIRHRGLERLGRGGRPRAQAPAGRATTALGRRRGRARFADGGAERLVLLGEPARSGRRRACASARGALESRRRAVPWRLNRLLG